MNTTMTAREKAEYIKERVSLPEVIHFYHHRGRHKNRTDCPFHGGNNDNLGYNDSVYHCFVCGARGDAVDFVMNLHKIDFPTATRLLDADFGLGLSAISEEERREAAKVHAMREAQRAEERKRADHNNAAFRLLCRYRHWLEERKLHTQAREFQMAWVDRQIDNIMDGGDFSGDAQAAVMSSYRAVASAEVNAIG